MFLKKLFLKFLLFTAVSLSASAYINLSPTTLDKNIKTGAYEEFTLYNDTTIPFRYKITPMSMGENKKVMDMSKWIEVYPKIVTVRPAESKKFKVYVKADKGALEGDYGAFLNIKQMSAPKLKGETDENLGAGMVIMVNLNMGIYGYVGDEVPKIEVAETSVYKKDNKSFLKMKVKNKTNRLVKMEVQVEGKKGHFFLVGSSRAFKGETLVFDHEITRIENEKARKVIIKDTETEKIIEEIKLK